MIDVPLLRKVLDFVTEHPEVHDQNIWAEKSPCGTSCCLAGHTVLMTGHEIDWREDGNGSGEYGADRVKTPIVVKGMRTDQISNVAGHELGLDSDQKETLFIDSETVEDLWRAANEFTNGEIEIPVQFQDEETV